MPTPPAAIFAALGAVVVGTLAGCSGGGSVGGFATATTFPPPPAPSPVVAFAETQPITALASQGNRLYAGTPDGLIVWQTARGSFDRWGEGHGLPDRRVRALATDDRLGLWVLTDGGLHLYNEDHFVTFEGAPADLASARHLVADADGRAAWAGGVGVLRLRDGAFTPFLPGARVTTMLRDADGSGVWVGTAKEGAYRWAVDRFLSFGADWGMTLHDIDGIALTRKGDVVFSGKGADGPRLAYYDGSRFWIYGAGGADVRVLGVVGKQVRIAVNRRLYALAVGSQSTAGIALVPSEQGAPTLRLKPLPGEAPPGLTTSLADAKGLYFGTAALGVVRPEAEALRTRDVRGDRDRLSVGCDAAACYFVGGGGRLYRLKAGDKAVEAVDTGDDRVMWVANDPSGDLVALRGHAGKSGAQLCLFDGGRLVPRQVAEIKVPSGEPHVTFARFAPGGDLWVGLSQRGEDGEVGNYGVAVLKASGGVVYHPASPEKKRGKHKGGLPLPEEVRGAAFVGDTVWLATLGGLVRIASGEADWVNRDEAPIGDICSDVAADKDGALWAASPDGLCRYEDGKWEAEDRKGPLELGASALQVDAAGALWVGTQTGVIRWDGSPGDKIEGTVGEGVLDLDLDRSGRLWVLTMDGVSVHPR